MIENEKPQTKPSVILDAIHTLEEFGDMESIAEHLKKLGIKGTKNKIDGCPISIYLVSVGAERVMTGLGYIRWWMEKDGQIYRVRLPRNISAFIIEFDKGSQLDYLWNGQRAYDGLADGQEF